MFLATLKKKKTFCGVKSVLFDSERTRSGAHTVTGGDVLIVGQCFNNGESQKLHKQRLKT